MSQTPLFQTPRADLMKLSKYDRIMIYLYRTLTAGQTVETFPSEILFDQGDVVEAMNRAVADAVIDAVVRNVPDVKYTFDARRAFPDEVEQTGPVTWLQTAKGKYRLLRTKRKNLIDLAVELPVIPALEYEVDPTPHFIANLLGLDEQAVFTRVRNVGLISKVLGFTVWPIQGHHRTTVSYGQIEIDEVHAGMDQGKGTLIPISGKGGQDKLSWSQALNLNTYAAEKPVFAGLAVRSIGLWRDSQNAIWTIEFSPDTNIDDIKIVNARRFILQTKF